MYCRYGFTHHGIRGQFILLFYNVLCHVASVARVRRQEIVNFMVPHPKRMYFLGKKCFFKNLLLYFGTWSIQSKCKVMITKEGSTKIVNFLTPRAGILVLGCGHIIYTVKMHYFVKESSSFHSGIDQTN